MYLILTKVADCKFKEICIDSTEIFFSKRRAAVELSLAKTKFFSLTLTVQGYLIRIAY